MPASAGASGWSGSSAPSPSSWSCSASSAWPWSPATPRTPPPPAVTAADPNAPLPTGALPADDERAFGVPYPGTATPDAPVLEIWEDFQCPACGAVEQANGAGIESLADAGKIQLIWRPTTFLDAQPRQRRLRARDGGLGLRHRRGQGEGVPQHGLRQPARAGGHRLDQRAAARIRRRRGHHRRRSRHVHPVRRRRHLPGLGGEQHRRLLHEQHPGHPAGEAERRRDPDGDPRRPGIAGEARGRGGSCRLGRPVSRGIARGVLITLTR